MGGGQTQFPQTFDATLVNEAYVLDPPGALSAVPTLAQVLAAGNVANDLIQNLDGLFIDSLNSADFTGIIALASDPSAGAGISAGLGVLALCGDGTAWMKTGALAVNWTQLGGAGAAQTLAAVLVTGADANGTGITGLSSLDGDPGVDVTITAANDAAAGKGITLTTGDGAAGDGGTLTLQGGTGAGGAGDGGNVSIFAGVGNDKGGDIDIYGGAGVTDDGGDLDIRGGDTAAAGAAGGDINLAAGLNTGGFFRGAAITLVGGQLAAHGKLLLESDGTTGNAGQVLVADGIAAVTYQDLVSAAVAVPPVVLTTVLYFDSTAGTGGLFYWSGAAYTRLTTNP